MFKLVLIVYLLNVITDDAECQNTTHELNWTREGVAQYGLNNPLVVFLGDTLKIHCVVNDFRTIWRLSDENQFRNCSCDVIPESCTNTQRITFSCLSSINFIATILINQNDQMLRSVLDYNETSTYYFTSFPFTDMNTYIRSGGSCFPTETDNGLRMALKVETKATVYERTKLFQNRYPFINCGPTPGPVSPGAVSPGGLERNGATTGGGKAPTTVENTTVETTTVTQIPDTSGISVNTDSLGPMGLDNKNTSSKLIQIGGIVGGLIGVSILIVGLVFMILVFVTLSRKRKFKHINSHLDAPADIPDGVETSSTGVFDTTNMTDPKPGHPDYKEDLSLSRSFHEYDVVPSNFRSSQSSLIAIPEVDERRGEVSESNSTKPVDYGEKEVNEDNTEMKRSSPCEGTRFELMASINHDAAPKGIDSDVSENKNSGGAEQRRGPGPFQQPPLDEEQLPLDDEHADNLITLQTPTATSPPDAIQSNGHGVLSPQLSITSFTSLALSRSVEVNSESLAESENTKVYSCDSTGSPNSQELPHTSAKLSKPQPVPRKTKPSADDALETIRDEDETPSLSPPTQKPKIKPRVAKRSESKATSDENVKAIESEPKPSKARVK